MSDKPGIDLTKELIHTPQGIAALGTIAASQLINEGQVTLWINPTGLIELIPKTEVDLSARFPPDLLDRLEEDQAIAILLCAGFPDDKIANYLQGRAGRTNG